MLPNTGCVALLCCNNFMQHFFEPQPYGGKGYIMMRLKSYLHYSALSAPLREKS